MNNSKNTSDSLSINIKNNSKKNEYKSTKNIFTKPKKKSSFFSLSRNKSNEPNLFSPSKANKMSNKELISNASQYLNEINTLFVENKSNNLSKPMNLSILVNKKNFQHSLKKDTKEKSNNRIKDFINKENMQKNNIFKNYLNLSNLKNNDNKFISLNIFNNNINKIDNNINNINNISNINNSYLLSPIKKIEEEENSSIIRNSQRINLNIKFPSITNSNNKKIDTSNITRSRNIFNSNLSGNILNNNSSLLNNSSFLNFCTKEQFVSFNSDSQSILFSCDENNIELQNKIIKNNDLREKFRNLSKPIKFNYNNSPVKKLKHISLKEINKSKIKTEQNNLKKTSFNTIGKYNFRSPSFSSIISNNLEKKKTKEDNKLILTNINDKANNLISDNENEGNLNNEINKTNIINNNSLSKKELLEKNKNDQMFEKSLHIIRKKSDNSKIIKKIGNIIKKGIRKDITIKNIKEEKNECIGGKIRKNILKHKINEKNEKKNRPENLKQNSIKTNNTKKEEEIQKNSTRKVKINSDNEESKTKTKNESPIKIKKKIKSSRYLAEYMSKALDIDNSNMLINKIKNDQLLCSIQSNKGKNIYQKNKFLKKLSDKAKNKNTFKLIKFSKTKLVIKENIEISSIILKNNKNENDKNKKEDINLILKENFLNNSCSLLKQEINQLFEEEENKIGINIYEYSKTFLPNKKCKLNYNFINYISKNVNFSSIYIPYVQKGKRGTKILPKNKLILYRNSAKLFFKNFISKYIETHDSEENKTFLLEITNKNIKIDLKWLKEYKDEEDDNLKIEKDDNLILQKDNNNISIISNQSIIHRPRGESMNINRNNIKFFINKISNKNIQNLRKSDKNIYSPKKLKFSISSKILGQQDYKFSVLTKSKFFAQKIEKVTTNSSININYDNTKNINENLDPEKLRAKFLNDEKVIQYLKYNPYVSIRKILRDNSVKCTKDNGIEDPFQFLKTLINIGESNKFKEYFSFVSEQLDINSKDEDGNTLLILCAKNGLIHLASLLLENGADVNKQNKKGNTALHYAISLKHFTLADLLTKYNAKEDVINNFGYTPWECIGKSVDEKFYS